MAKTIRIGHASGTTNNDGSAKPAADQVLTRDYYDGSWTLMLRPSSRAVASKSADLCEAACNNDNIRYSQSSRHSFKEKALAAAGLADTDENLAKITVDNIHDITTKCYADCSSFMTFCAVAGGADFSYGSNAALTSTMEERFTANNSYEVYKDKEHLKSTSLLQRGDILVSSSHAVMVLDNGDKVIGSGIYKDNAELFTARKVAITATSVLANKITIKVKMTELTNASEKTVAEEELKQYDWYYYLTALKDNEQSSDSFKGTKVAAEFTVTKLTPDTAYLIKVVAKEKTNGGEISSASLLITTPQQYPTAVADLAVSFPDKTINLDYFKLTFTAPESWGNAELKHAYRIYLFVNGKQVAYSTTALSASTTYKNTKIMLKKITDDTNLFSYGDRIQIGILPMLKTGDEYIGDFSQLRASAPILITNSFKFLNNLFINIQNTFNRTIVYLNKE